MSTFQDKTANLSLLQPVALCVSLLGLAILLTGCGSGLSSGTEVIPPKSSAVHVSGIVHGGQQPVAQATVQLYTVGTTGLKSASTALIGSTVQTDSNGNFNITGTYSCSSATQVYITATGGNPGAGTNSAIALVAALGPCSSLTHTTFITINEVTTIAAAYALAPFASDIAHIGATGSNPTGLVNAFANAALLANTSVGSAGGAALPTGVTVPLNEINTLADIIATCINSTGSSSGPCTTIFSATGASETFGASLAIAKNPGAAAVTALYTLPNGSAPFQPTLSSSSAPNDFSIAITASGGGALATPYGIAIDASGDAWVTNETGTTVTEFSPTGSVLATPTATGLVGAQGIAVAPSGTIWVASTAGNSLVAFTTSAGAVTATNVYTGNGLSGPTAVALDATSNVFVANLNGNSVSGFTSAGQPLSFSPITNASLTTPHSIACGGPSSDIYVTSGTGSILHLSDSNGALVDTVTDNTLQGPVSIFYDLQASHLFVTGYTTGATIAGALSEFASNDTATSVSPVALGSSSPEGVAADGTSAWVANSGASGSLGQFTYGSATSPAAGFGSLNAPVGVAVDASGSVWTANSGSNTVSVFVGLATPVTTPIAANQK